MISGCDAVGNDIGVYARDATNHGTATDAAKLLNSGQPAHDHAIADLDVTAKLRAVCERHIVSDMAVVAHVTVAHEVSTRADRGEAATAFASKAHRHVLADDAILTEGELRARGVVTADLCRAAQNRTGMYNRSRANGRAAGYRHAGNQPDTGLENRMRPYDAKRADLDIRAKLRAAFNDRRWMNCHLRHRRSWR
jgi:hypothetical protein